VTPVRPLLPSSRIRWRCSPGWSTPAGSPERVLAGWTYAPGSDVERKTSPYLAAWADLPSTVQQRPRLSSC
jgi:hypothetical protein